MYLLFGLLKFADFLVLLRDVDCGRFCITYFKQRFVLRFTDYLQ
jgi:hypothetical protein